MLGLLVTGVAMGGLHRLQQSPDESVGHGPRRRPAAEGGQIAAQTPERVIALEGERIVLRPVQRSVSAVGSFFGYDEITVTAEVKGRVAKVYHDVGDIVRPGDVLMELDKTDLELDLEQTRRVLGIGGDPAGHRRPGQATLACRDRRAHAGFRHQESPFLDNERSSCRTRLVAIRAGETAVRRRMP